MTEETQTPQSRPLVTFALFAYNQDKYIREAVEGAFSQTYEPLEIILSDDCSSDRTFEIMQEMAANYEGPHDVKVRQSERNRGIGAHVAEVFEVARGKIVVVGAGDDVSLPKRTETTVEFFDANDQKLGLVTNLRSMWDHSDIVVTPPQTPEELLSRNKWIKGASAAYHRELITEFPPFVNGSHHEDEILCLRALLRGQGFGHIYEPLVYYNESIGVSSEYNASGLAHATRTRSITEVKNRTSLIRQWKKDITNSERFDLLEHLEFQESYYKFINYLVGGDRLLSNALDNIRVIGLKCAVYEVIRYKANVLLRFYIFSKKYKRP